MTVTTSQLRDRLRAVDDPALDADIVSLGLIEELRVTDDGIAQVTLDFNAPFAPDEKTIGDRVRDAVRELGLEPAVTASPFEPDRSSPIPGVRNVIAVSSGKGGVGKTTIATNLAAGLSEMGATVGLLDADIYGPNVPRMIGVEGEPGIADDETLVPPEAYGVKLMSMAFLIANADDPAMLRGPMIDKIVVRLLEEVDWGHLDHLVVDLPPGTGDAQLTLLQTIPVTGSVIVTTPEEVALDDVRKGMRMFSNHETPAIGIVENMSGFQCPDCGGSHDLFGRDGGHEVAAEYGVPVIGEIPMDPEIGVRNDDGAPAALRGGSIADAFCGLSERVANRIGAINRANVAGLDLDELARSTAIAGSGGEATTATPTSPERDESDDESDVTGGLDISSHD